MKERIPHISPIEDILERYPTLTLEVQRRLTDQYNSWISLGSLAYGDEETRENALANAKLRLETRGKIYWSYTYSDLVEIYGNIFTETDKFHLQEIGQLAVYANVWIRKGIPRKEAQIIYNYLIPLLYGRKNER